MWDHDGRVFGTSLANPENSAALDGDRLALLSVPLSERWAAARSEWSRSLHKAAVRDPFYGQTAEPVGWLAKGDESAFQFVAEPRLHRYTA